jgi:outer membrane immunogenic protein
MKMKRLSAIAIGLVAATSLGGTAMAADLTEPVPEDFDWTGPYIGAHAGWGWIDLDGKYDTSDIEDGEDDFVDDDNGKFDLDDDDFLAGLQIGYNWQVDHFVLGVEGDISFGDWHDHLSNSDDEEVSFDTNTLITLRARAGLAFDNLMVYATAGGAWTDTEFKASDGIADNGERDLDDIGLVVGGGAELAVDEHWSVRAEGLYYYFDEKEDIQSLTSDTDPDDFIRLNDIVVARVGLNFRF